MAEIVLSSEYSVLPDASAFTEIIGPETMGSSDEKHVDVRVCRLPDLWLPSGQIVACDSFILDGKPFTRRVKPGKYPLVLAIAIYTDDERIAFAQLQFSHEPIVMWEMAVTEGQDIANLGFDELYGYGVDSGTGSFADPGAQKLLIEATRDDDSVFDRISAEMEKVYKHTRCWVHACTANGSAALFSSGVGDGFYASYFGLDESGDAVAVITDFGMIDWQRP